MRYYEYKEADIHYPTAYSIAKNLGIYTKTGMFPYTDLVTNYLGGTDKTMLFCDQGLMNKVRVFNDFYNIINMYNSLDCKADKNGVGTHEINRRVYHFTLVDRDKIGEQFKRLFYVFAGSPQSFTDEWQEYDDGENKHFFEEEFY